MVERIGDSDLTEKVLQIIREHVRVVVEPTHDYYSNGYDIKLVVRQPDADEDYIISSETVWVDR